MTVFRFLYTLRLNKEDCSFMTPWAQQFIPLEDLTLFYEIRYLAENMRDVELGEDEDGRQILLSCHMLCRAIAKLYPQLTVVDGFFRTGLRHAWLVTPKGSMIDPYVPGAVGVLILPRKGSTSSAIDVYYSMYEKNGLVGEFEDFCSWSFARAVEITEHALRAVQLPYSVR